MNEFRNFLELSYEELEDLNLKAKEQRKNRTLNIVLQEERLRYYTHITAPAFGENNGIVMEQDCFMYELEETPSPNAEIGEVDYFDTHSYASQPAQVPGVVMILEKLKTDGLVN